MTSIRINPSRKELLKSTTEELKKAVEQEAWVALKQYFDGIGNGAEAKIAVVTLGILAKEMQSKNNSRQLDILEKRLMISKPNISHE